MVEPLKIILSFFRVYAPIVLGTSYVLGYERKKLDNLLKFFVISLHISILQYLLGNSFEINVADFIALPVYIYLSLFHYFYSGVVYDVLFAPLFHILLEYFYEMVRNVERERSRVRLEHEQGNMNAKSKEGYLAGLLVDTFKPDLIYLLK